MGQSFFAKKLFIQSILPLRKPSAPISQILSAKKFHFCVSNDDIDAYFSAPKSTDDLFSALNDLDRLTQVKPAANPRWDVIENDKALSITRNMSGLAQKDVKHFVEFPNGVGFRSFFGYRMNDYGCVLIYRGRYPPATLVLKHVGVEKRKPDGNIAVAAYTVLIELPGMFYKTFNIKMAVENDVLKVTIPKEREDLIPGISFGRQRCWYYRPRKGKA